MGTNSLLAMPMINDCSTGGYSHATYAIAQNISMAKFKSKFNLRNCLDHVNAQLNTHLSMVGPATKKINVKNSLLKIPLMVMINIMNGNDTVQLQYAGDPPRIRDAANAVVAVAEQLDSQAVVLVRKLVKPARGIVVGR